MKNIKKIIAVATAAASILTATVTANAHAVVDTLLMESQFETHRIVGNGEYVFLSGNNSITKTYGSTGLQCVLTTTGTGTIGFSDANSTIYGRSALRLRGCENGTALMRVLIPHDKIPSDKIYHVSMVMRKGMLSDKAKSYATMNYVHFENSDHTANLYNGSMWTKTNLGTGSANGGYGNDTDWYEYTADIPCEADPPEFRIYIDSANPAGTWDRTFICQLRISKSDGTTIFFENFEDDFAQTDWQQYGSSTDSIAKFQVKEQTGDISNHILWVKAYHQGIGTAYVNLPKVLDNTYIVSYEKKVVGDTTVSVSFDSLPTGQGKIGSGTGKVTKTFVTDGNTDLRISAEGWGFAQLDNFLVKDKNGNIVYEEDFESDSYNISTPRLTYGDGERTVISNTGTYNVSSKLKNNFSFSPVNAKFIVAAYNSDETELRKVQVVSATVNRDNESTLSASIELESDEHIRVMWWDGLSTINSLRKCYIYNHN